MGNNVSMDNVKNQLNDEINSSDPNRLKIAKNMGLDSVTLHPKNNSNKKAFSNPNFDSDYKYLIGLGAPEETVQLMDNIKIKRTEQQQTQVDTLKSRYNNITNAIKMYQQDEKQIWLNLNVAKDPEYMKKRQAFLIHQKIKRLRNQRDKVIGELSNKYEKASLIEENSKQLDFRNKNLIKTQQEIINKTNNEIYTIDSNIMRKVCGAAQYIACADGGANRLYDEMEGLVIPNAVIGDLDSLRPDVEFFLCEKGTKIVKIVDQDRHDLDKSLDYLHTNCAKICEEFTSKSGEQMAGRFSVIILGALGGRFDQDMANLNAIHKWTSSFASLALVAKENIVFLLDEI